MREDGQIYKVIVPVEGAFIYNSFASSPEEALKNILNKRGHWHRDEMKMFQDWDGADVLTLKDFEEIHNA